LADPALNFTDGWRPSHRQGAGGCFKSLYATYAQVHGDGGAASEVTRGYGNPAANGRLTGYGLGVVGRSTY
jgi:hypothetical protein